MTDTNVETDPVEGVEVQDDSVRGSLVAALEEVESRDPEEKLRSEDGKFTKKDEVVAEPIIEAPVTPAPESWTAEAKAEWAKLPAAVQSYVSKREAEIHQAFTRHDGEIRLGKEMKDVISPYLPIIQAEGGTPASAVKDLLNTAYILRTGTPERKTAILQQVAQQYGVDLSQSPAQQVDPTIAQLQKKVEELSEIANPEALEKRLQERLEIANISTEVQAFAADPKNVHYETVKPVMAVLFQSGQAKDMQEAYDMACHANPSIRSTLNTAKPKEDIAKKKQAAVSVTGSPSQRMANTSSPKNSVREELEAAYDEAFGSTI